VARVLVVDDEPDILLLHRLNLENAGHEVLLAADGSKALERITMDRPDCVVLDVMMPVLDGWGVLEALQALTGAPPVLVVSAKSTDADIDHALSLGAKGYLSKPFNATTLLAEVAKLTADAAGATPAS
jgi:DNA-binding response OmpR family regulator